MSEFHCHNREAFVYSTTRMAYRNPQSEPVLHASEFRTSFQEQGFFGPVPIFDTIECHRLAHLLKLAPTPAEWSKGHAVSSSLFFELATKPAIVDKVVELLGGNVMLWGARLAYRKPGHVHPWHTDIETASEEARSVTVWIGLKNTNQQSSLQLISRSHRFGCCIQQCAHKDGKNRRETATQDVVDWGHRIDPSSELLQPAIADGEALFFDGRMWHGSSNSNATGTRVALIFNYATPTTRIRIPDVKVLDWPFHLLDSPRPPCIMIRGSSPEGFNNVVVGPVPTDFTSPSRIPVFAESLHLPLEGDQIKGFKPYPLFRGSTSSAAKLSCHVSVLNPGVTPHEPHVHDDEELLIMLSGEAELIIVDDHPTPRQILHKVHHGSFAYYPAHQRHTIRAMGSEPATYLMFKWHSEIASNEHTPLQTRRLSIEDIISTPPTRSSDGWNRWRLFAGSTKYLRKLTCHVSSLEPNAGYAPHIDAYDVAMLLLSGQVETLGKRIDPMGVIFYPAGEPHGIRNIGATRALYLVFEFHSDDSSPTSQSFIHQFFNRLPGPFQRMIRIGLKILRKLFLSFRSN